MYHTSIREEMHKWIGIYVGSSVIVSILVNTSDVLLFPGAVILGLIRLYCAYRYLHLKGYRNRLVQFILPIIPFGGMIMLLLPLREAAEQEAEQFEESDYEDVQRADVDRFFS
ncbi:MAG: hypothetical protein AAFV53_13690 [Myxococcota bacterium]